MNGGIVFDLDDTLIDRRDTLADYARRLWRDFDLQRDAPLPRFVASFLAWEADGKTPVADLCDAIARACPRSKVDSSRISGHFEDLAWTAPPLSSGVAAELRKLRAAGIPLGIITNGEAESQRSKLRSTRLDELVDHCIISAEFGAEKPDSSIFLSMCATLGIEPAASWFIGDHPVCDVWGAHRVGFRAVWLQKRIPWPDDRIQCYTHSVPDIDAALALVTGGV